jgi:copper homeostasis protein
MSRNKILEIACFNVESALIAQSSGADRIELCENYEEGGLTPSQKIILETRDKIQVPLHVIIRPRAGDFVYSIPEIEEMKKSILFCKEHKIDGIVLGVLTGANEIDGSACNALIELAKPMSLTFHRAVDQCINLDKAFENLVQMGIERVLSSGCKNSAVEGIVQLKKLQEKYGEKIVIMPGGGIRSSNIKRLLESGCKEFHSAALMHGEKIADAAEIKKLKQFL